MVESKPPSRYETTAYRRVTNLMAVLAATAETLDEWRDGRTLQRALSLADEDDLTSWTDALGNVSVSAARAERFLEADPSDHNLTHMNQTEAFRAAIGTAVATLGDVATGMRRNYRTVQSYLRGERPVTSDAARNLSQYLRRRIDELKEAADKLEDSKQENDDG